MFDAFEYQFNTNTVFPPSQEVKRWGGGGGGSEEVMTFP